MSLSFKNLLFVTHLVAFTLLSGCAEENQQSDEAETAELSSEELMLKAQLRIGQKQDVAAIRDLKRALTKDETNPEARFLLGKIYYENQQMASAEKELLLALESGYDMSEALTLLARVYLGQKKNKELQDIDLGRLRASDKGTVLALQGLSNVKSGLSEEGKEMVAQAVRLAPSNTEARLTYGNLLAEDNDLINARRQAEAILMSDEENAGAWILLGNIEFIEGHLAGAEEAYTEAMAVAVNPTEARLKRAQLRIEQKNFEQAQADIDELLITLPRSPSVHYVQAILYFEQEKYREALESLSIAEQDQERHPEALLYAAISYNKLGHYEQAINYANQYHSLKPANLYSQRLLALVAISMGEYDVAEKRLRRIVGTNPGDVASLNLLANTFLARGETERGLEILARVAELAPDSPVALSRLGAGQLLAGDPYIGVEHLESALAIDPRFEQAEMLLVLTYVRAKDYDKAIAAAENFRENNPTSAQPLNLLGRVYLDTARPNQARQAFTKALELDPANASARHGLAQLALAEGEFSEARAQYEAVLADKPDYLPTLLKLAEMSVRQNDIDSMLAYLQRAIEQHPDHEAPRVLLAQYYLTINKPEQVAMLIGDMPDEMRGHSDVLKVAALAQLAKKDFIAAQYSIAELAARQPRAPEIYYLRALLSAARNERQAMEKELKRALELSPDYTTARFMLARLYVSDGNVSAAEPHLEKLAELVPNSSELLLLQAATARAQGNQQAAIDYAEQAFMTSSSTTTLLHLVGYLHQHGEYERERQLLEQWIARYPQDIQAKIAEANMHALLGDYATAIEKYRGVLQLDENNVAALNGLAWYLKERQPEEALRYASKVVELDPESAAVQDTLAMVLLTNGEMKKAQWAINRALAQDPGNPSVRYHAALISARSGKRGVAIEELESLLVSNTAFPEREDAEALLQEIKNEG